jgi:hypothetical protein
MALQPPEYYHGACSNGRNVRIIAAHFQQIADKLQPPNQSKRHQRHKAHQMAMNRPLVVLNMAS